MVPVGAPEVKVSIVPIERIDALRRARGRVQGQGSVPAFIHEQERKSCDEPGGCGVPGFVFLF